MDNEFENKSSEFSPESLDLSKKYYVKLTGTESDKRNEEILQHVFDLSFYTYKTLSNIDSVSPGDCEKLNEYASKVFNLTTSLGLSQKLTPEALEKANMLRSFFVSKFPSKEAQTFTIPGDKLSQVAIQITDSAHILKNGIWALEIIHKSAKAGTLKKKEYFDEVLTLLNKNLENVRESIENKYLAESLSNEEVVGIIKTTLSSTTGISATIDSGLPVEVKVEEPKNLSAKFRFSSFLLRTIVFNVLTNAEKSVLAIKNNQPDKLNLNVRFEQKTNGRVALVFADNGLGLPKGKKIQKFELGKGGYGKNIQSNRAGMASLSETVASKEFGGELFLRRRVDGKQGAETILIVNQI